MFTAVCPGGRWQEKWDSWPRVGSRKEPLRGPIRLRVAGVPSNGLCHASLPLPGLIHVPVFLSSSPDLSQLPIPHVHSTPAPPPGPSQPISHASMATASSFTPAPIQGTVSSFSLSLWTHCYPVPWEKLCRRMVAQPWARDTLATS